MTSFNSYILQGVYEDDVKEFDRLARFDSLIDWEAFCPIIASSYHNLTERGGRPNIDPVVMLKLLVLQHLYGFSDPQLQWAASDSISFRRFIGFQRIPDYTTVWLFGERLVQNGKLDKVWNELQRQMDRKGLRVERRAPTAQDVAFITADHGAPESKPRGDQALTRRSRDGTWTKKLKKAYFGYKLHVKTDLTYGLIRAIKTTTASVHDSRVDLSRRGEVVYRDRGYFGVPAKGFDATMQRGTRAGPIDVFDRLRNLRISRRRAPIERVFAMLKRIFRAGHVLVTTVPRVKVKNLFSCLCFNLMQMLALRRQVQAWDLDECRK
jgi:IS5 family transposase